MTTWKRIRDFYAQAYYGPGFYASIVFTFLLFDKSSLTSLRWYDVALWLIAVLAAGGLDNRMKRIRDEKRKRS